VPLSTKPFDADWLRTLPASLQFHILEQLFSYSLQHLKNFAGAVDYLRDIGSGRYISADQRLPFHRLLATYLLWRGEIAEVRQLMRQNPESFNAGGFEGCVCFLLDDNRKAIQHFKIDLRLLVDITGKNDVFFYNATGLFFIMALLKSADSGLFSQIKNFIARTRLRQPGNMLADAYRFLEAIVLVQEGALTEIDTVVDSGRCNHGAVALFAGLATLWLYGELPGEMVEGLFCLFTQAKQGGFRWLAMEYAELLARVAPSSLKQRNLPAVGYGGYAAAIKRETGLASIAAAIMPARPWERKLKALAGMAASRPAGRGATVLQDNKSRLVWLVDGHDKRLSISPREQKMTAGGEWSNGRPVALDRLYAGGMSFLTEQDRRICNAIKRRQDSKGIYYEFDMAVVPLHMIGHPLLFLADSPKKPVEFLKGEPQLLVEEIEGRLLIKFVREFTGEGVTVFRETPSRFRVFEINDNHRRIARIIGQEGLRAPLAVRGQVMAAIANISSFMTIHSAIAVDAVDRESAAIEDVPAATGIHIHLMPLGAGFKLEMLVRPFAVAGPYLPPGQGARHVIAKIAGRRLQARRNLEFEEEEARRVERACPTLAARSGPGREWLLQETEDCLQILLELREIKDKVTVEWPAGEKLSVKNKISLNRLAVRIRKKNDWFEVSGRLEIDENLVMDMKKLLVLIRKNSSRFIPLGDGQFLALTREFYSRLTDLNIFSEKLSSGIAVDSDSVAVRVHPLAAPALEDFTAHLTSLDADKDWLMQMDRRRDTEKPRMEIPAALHAELRDYHIEGYRWLGRMAHWGVGCCLADDMGLGKTVQALAVILRRAPQGPTLVVAPTSVCMNWQIEARRFAPRLNVGLFGGKDREKSVKALKGFDVLIASYTLLQQQEKLLAAVDWQTIVLDEAQAIKNMATKRSHAAMALDGRFKLILTGTPIENHLGELWNLFNFINPGLLGSLASFNERFAVAIEKYHDHEAEKRLKKLIRPFILRRVKSEVLAELPSRTEIPLWVEMSRDERAFYEALRHEALDKLEKTAAPPGYNIQILAEIMRLRRACCNARLVMPESTIVSSKLELFSKVVEELLENRHKCLVFSQFVQHLAIIRTVLDKKGIDYKYLDGSTPVRERNRQVEAFQAGQGDLFLISLKAGGLGLNLTAADYVIHMDPWWNPAVEDQASDRAHRIGQKFPVTIYRLVTKNTIEEKIVRLHKQKRWLANSLLAGSDMSAGISADELLNLLREA